VKTHEDRKTYGKSHGALRRLSDALEELEPHQDR
jgi:hypothetical protein